MRAQTYLLSFLLIGTLFLAACGQGIDDPLNWETEEFTFTDHNNEDFGSSDLEGKVWLADFVFTNCTTVCLPMMANMKGVQEELQAQGLDVEIVSFSVDPTVDTPETLKSYAESYDADLTSWHMLTGYSQEEIAEFALENFKAIAQKPQDDDQVIHGTSFYLIDHEGVIMKDYDGLNPPVEDIVRDAEILLEEAEG
ncbi:SCO family protein [Planococcus maitriensis]|uniref:SCO family protein n=1 Tax=Planococcus maitriensis TaxID=221799 RepID=A0A365K548_9BACL|nr:SCO family protein [Planococcus maitriensis]RAZ67774.1 SCO family protein [Planococcus maitriensis]